MAAPLFANLDDTPIYTENGFAVVLDADATISDPDPGAFAGATLTLARSGGASADDILTGPLLEEGQIVIADVLVATYSYADGTLVITFTADATAADVNAVLQQLTYANASDAPPASVTIGYVFDNGEQATGNITVTIAATNDAPGVDGLTTVSFYQPGGSALTLSPGIIVADPDSTMLSGALVRITQGLDGDDVLSASTGTTGISASYNVGTGELMLSGAATLEQYRQVLATVAYASSDPAPGANGQRSLEWTVTDAGGQISATATTLLDFLPTVDLDQSGAGLDFATSFTEGGAAVAIADSDAFMSTSSSITGITVVLTNAKPGDTLAVNGAGLTVNTDSSVPGQITLTISANGFSVPTDSTLRSITFGNPNANIDPAARLLTVTVSDQNNASVAAHATVNIAGAVDDQGLALDDTAATAGNTTLVVAAAQGVLANDTDPDGLSVITATVATSQGGTIQFASDGSYTYTPPAFFFGTDTVGYTAQDPFGSQVSATLRISVGAAPGTVGDDSYTAPSGNFAVDAGVGNDSITFGFRLVDATISWSGNHVTIDGPSSHAVLSGFERYVFADGTVDNNDGSPLVDDLFYHARNHDVWNAHVDADAHYNSVGWHEGRDPNAFFSTNVYLAVNADVRAAGVNPLAHFDLTGWQEGRIPSLSFGPAQYLAAYPDVAAADIDPLAHFLQFGYQENRLPVAPSELIGPNGFDYVYYLNHNPDVLAAGVDPFQHFQTVGWQEGRNPNALFDVNGYLATYADVAAAQVNPLDHYNLFGWHEGRDPSVNFDTTAYLAAYPDVATAGVNPLMHYLQFGSHEGRSTFADGLWG